MPGTFWASSDDAFSGQGRASPYEDEVSAPEWHATMTMSAPAALTRGMTCLACSTMPAMRILPSRLALSQIWQPGVVNPTMPTLT